jgi:hypothetical protein
MKRGDEAQRLEAMGREEANQRLLDLAAQAHLFQGIRQGLEDARKGRSRPAEEFFREFEDAHNL